MENTLQYQGHILQERELVLEKFLGKQGKNRHKNGPNEDMARSYKNSRGGESRS